MVSLTVGGFFYFFFQKAKYLLVVLLPGKAAPGPNIFHHVAASEEDKMSTIQYNHTTVLGGCEGRWGGGVVNNTLMSQSLEGAQVPFVSVF